MQRLLVVVPLTQNIFMPHQNSLIDFCLSKPAGFFGGEENFDGHFFSAPLSHPNLPIATFANLLHHLNLFCYSPLYLLETYDVGSYTYFLLNTISVISQSLEPFAKSGIFSWANSIWSLINLAGLPYLVQHSFVIVAERYLEQVKIRTKYTFSCVHLQMMLRYLVSFYD